MDGKTNDFYLKTCNHVYTSILKFGNCDLFSPLLTKAKTYKIFSIARENINMALSKLGFVQIQLIEVNHWETKKNLDNTKFKFLLENCQLNVKTNKL